MKAHTSIIFAKPQHLIALLFFIFSWPVLVHGADTDWGTDLAANAGLAPTATRIYSLNGRCVGSSLSSLPRGIYIVNGRKIWK